MSHKDDPNACLLGDGILESGEWTSFVGLGGLGKTRLALWMSICLITGREWLGFKAGQKRPKVTILSGENGIRRWKKDLGVMMTALSDSERAEVDEKLLILASIPGMDVDLCPTNPSTATRLETTLSTAQPDLVIFDPLAEMIAGDESKTPDMLATLRSLREVIRKSCPTAAVMIIHHGRNGAQNVSIAGDNFNAGGFGRGSKAFFSRVRCELQLAPGDRNDPRVLVLACGKTNNTEKFQARGVVFNPETFTYSVDPSFDIDVWRAKVAGDAEEAPPSLKEVLTAVRDLTSDSQMEAPRGEVKGRLIDLGAKERTVQQRIKKALELGLLEEGTNERYLKLGKKGLPE